MLTPPVLGLKFAIRNGSQLRSSHEKENICWHCRFQLHQKRRRLSSLASRASHTGQVHQAPDQMASKAKQKLRVDLVTRNILLTKSGVIV